MKRWWIAVVAVVGVALGLLLMPRPDSGGDIVDRKGVTLDGPGFQASNDTDRMLVAGTPVAPAVGGPRPGMTTASPEYVAAQAAMDTPEANAARLVGSGWSHVRLALYEHKGDPAADALLLEVEQLNGDLREMRRAPANYDWAAMEARQTDLIARVRASPYAGDSAEGLKSVETRLEQYRSGTLPAVGAAAGGEPPPAPMGDPKVRPR